MKKLTLIIILSSIIQVASFSQSCLPNGISFTTQGQIDSFQINYPGCSVIEGDMKILGSNVFNLNGLSTLTAVEGNFDIGDHHTGDLALNNLFGLHNLTSVGGSLTLLHSDSLINLEGLDNLIS
ncbi:MAG: hypothetical protein U9R19_14775, partial [Bacteroidota bacterium]|nr:hypothetical protein [Bacteroidota bacterium]